MNPSSAWAGVNYRKASLNIHEYQAKRLLEKYGVIHQTIPPAAHTWQSDVETVHNTIEIHLYDNEDYFDHSDFINMPGAVGGYHLVQPPLGYISKN